MVLGGGKRSFCFIYCTVLSLCILTHMHYFYENNESFPDPTLATITVPPDPMACMSLSLLQRCRHVSSVPFLDHASLRSKSSVLLIPLSFRGPWSTQVLNTCSWNKGDHISRQPRAKSKSFMSLKSKKKSQNFQSWPQATASHCLLSYSVREKSKEKGDMAKSLAHKNTGRPNTAISLPKS